MTDYEEYNTEWFERQLIERARQGDAEAGLEALVSAAFAIDAKRFDSLLLPYLADCILQFREGIPLDRALGVEDRKPGGRPTKYDACELAAVDILLRDHGGLSPENAVAWIAEQIGAERSTIQKYRRQFDSRYNRETKGGLMDAWDRDLLLDQAGALRNAVEPAL